MAPLVRRSYSSKLSVGSVLVVDISLALHVGGTTDRAVLPPSNRSPEDVVSKPPGRHFFFDLGSLTIWSMPPPYIPQSSFFGGRLFRLFRRPSPRVAWLISPFSLWSSIFLFCVSYCYPDSRPSPFPVRPPITFSGMSFFPGPQSAPNASPYTATKGSWILATGGNPLFFLLFFEIFRPPCMFFSSPPMVLTSSDDSVTVWLSAWQLTLFRHQ